MTIRPATADDHHDELPWLRADDPTGGRRVLVEEDDGGRLVGAALRVSGPLQPHLDFLELGLPETASVELLQAAAAAGANPVLVRTLPGTAGHRLALAAGATVFERVPAARIDPADPEVIAWVDAHHGPSRPGTDYGTERLTELWIDYYVSAHRHFGVTDDRAVLREVLGPFVERAVDASLTRIVEQDGEPVAIAYVFREGSTLMALVDSLDPDHSRARRHVEVAMAALLEAVPPEPLELDGHESGVHYPAVLASIPNVTAGDLTPMELLRLAPPA